MGQSDNDALVMETIRRRTGNDAVGENTRFIEDLRLGESARQVLFSFLMEAFTARGVNLPARGCFVSTFMPCATPGEVQAIIRGAFGKKATPRQAEATPAVAKTPAATESPAPGPAASPTVEAAPMPVPPTPVEAAPTVVQ